MSSGSPSQFESNDETNHPNKPSFPSTRIPVSARSDDFIKSVQDLMDSSSTTGDFESRAVQLIDRLTTSEYNEPPYPDTGIRLDLILKSMLHFAQDCGGEAGKRYTVCAICACSHQEDHESTLTLEFLQSLATTWVSHLLFVFKANSGHARSGPRWRALKHKVLIRDGNRCTATGYPDVNHPSVKEEEQEYFIYTDAAHIVNNAITMFDGDASYKTRTYLSALTTFNILRNYAAMPWKTMEDFALIVNDPSNVITLGLDANYGFNSYSWSLKETNVPNKYTVVYYAPVHGLRNKPEHIIFRDHSNLDTELSPIHQEHSLIPTQQSDTLKDGIPLPNPHFLRIHFAIAGVLRMSGAGKAIDDSIRRSGYAGPPTFAMSHRIWVGDDHAILPLRSSVKDLMIQIADR